MGKLSERETSAARLEPFHECTEREVEMMVGKAECAWANWQTVADNPTSTHLQTAYKSEYEATVRCIDMLVKNDLYEIQAHVAELARAEFGI